MFLRRYISLLIFATAAFASACTDKGKVSETKAKEHVERLAQVADEDVEQLRVGLPLGAKALGEAWDLEEGAIPEPGFMRARLDKVRDGRRELAMAKSTFFALTDSTGQVLRSDQDPDVLAGKKLDESFPALRKVLEGETIETFGVMPELQGSRSGPDEQWLVASPVRDEEGKVRGAYVSGWSLERYAHRLEYALKSDVTKEASEGSGKIPLTYVFVFRGKNVYGAPITPAVNEEALEALDLPAATRNGVFHRQLEIAGRNFGVAAMRVPKLGDEAGVALIRSEI